MGLHPIYLVIKSESIRKSDKPWFRIAATEIPTLPALFKGYNPNTNKYDDIRVTASPSGEVWNVKMEYNNRAGEAVIFAGWAASLEEAGKKLGIGVTEVIKPLRDGGVNVRPVWKDEVGGHTTATYCSEETQSQENGEVTKVKVHYWWEVVRVSLEHDDHGPLWHETARIAYMEKASEIALDKLKKRKGNLTEQEGKELEEKEKNLGYVPISLADYKEIVGWEKMSDEEMEKMEQEIRRESEGEDSGAEEDGKPQRGTRYGAVLSEEQRKDPHIMGTE